MRWYNETTGEFRKHRTTRAKTVHEAEFIAVIKAIQDNMMRVESQDTIEIRCDRETVVSQLNHLAGIKDDAVRRLADSAWLLSYRAKLEKKVDIRFAWVSRKNNPAGKMLGV